MHKGLIYKTSYVVEKNMYSPMVGNMVLCTTIKSNLLIHCSNPPYCYIFSSVCPENNQKDNRNW